MAINKIRNDFDSANPGNSDRIGAFLTDGTEVASINASNQLEVAVGNTVTVSATDLDIRDLSGATDSVNLNDGTNSLVINADGSLNITDNGGSLTVDASQLDIDDLVNTTDSVAIGDSTNIINLQQNDAVFNTSAYGITAYGVRRDADTSPVSADGDAHPFVFDSIGQLKTSATLESVTADDAADAGTNPIKVGSRAHDVSSALTSLGDGDRADLLSDHYRRVFTNGSYNVGWSVSAGNASDTATQIDGTKLDGRRAIRLQNLGSDAFEMGPAGTVTFGAGYHIPKNAEAEFEMGEALDVYIIADTGKTPAYRLVQAA